MAELSGSQPSGPTQSSPFNPGRPPPPQEGDLAARNAEEKFVWVMGVKRGGRPWTTGAGTAPWTSPGPQSISRLRIRRPRHCRKETPAGRQHPPFARRSNGHWWLQGRRRWDAEMHAKQEPVVLRAFVTVIPNMRVFCSSPPLGSPQAHDHHHRAPLMGANSRANGFRQQTEQAKTDQTPSKP